jgi:hypothetical protein
VTSGYDRAARSSSAISSLTIFIGACIAFGCFTSPGRLAGREHDDVACDAYGSGAYSARACSTTGILGSACSHNVKRSL